ncbi:hypothetical protein JL720_8378 [Aureococcus anophagefferens]|nr:hypothetical protein JL720_8378 [Aureococcus anophagefferens]
MARAASAPPTSTPDDLNYAAERPAADDATDGDRDDACPGPWRPSSARTGASATAGSRAGATPRRRRRRAGASATARITLSGAPPRAPEPGEAFDGYVALAAVHRVGLGDGDGCDQLAAWRAEVLGGGAWWLEAPATSLAPPRAPRRSQRRGSRTPRRRPAPSTSAPSSPRGAARRSATRATPPWPSTPSPHDGDAARRAALALAEWDDAPGAAAAPRARLGGASAASAPAFLYAVARR